MKKFLLFAFLVFLVAGCAEDTTNNNSTTEGQTSQEQLNKVDDAFTNEFKKYVTDEATVNKIAQAVYDHCKTSSSSNAVTYNTINTYNADTTTFKVMPILTCGTRNPMGDDMKAFMNGVGQAINPDYQFTMPSIRP